MNEDAAGILAWAKRAHLTSDEAWKEMQDVNEEVDWDTVQILKPPEDPEIERRHPETTQ